MLLTGGCVVADLPAYATTTVAVSKSQEELRVLLRRHGAESFQFGEGRRGDDRLAGVEFSHRGHRVVLLVPIKIPAASEMKRIERAARKKHGSLVPDEWAEQRTWRVIAWTLRARMVAVEEGVETFEQAFLPHIVNPATGKTIYTELAEFGRVELADALPELGAGG